MAADRLHPLARPRLRAITINVGIGRMKAQGGDELPVIEGLKKITGQKPKLTRARKAIAGFKLRAGQTVGLQVTLRGKRMADFFERLVTVVLPRVRDFRGVERRSVNQGVISFGLDESQVFPELRPEDANFGMNISITTSATSPTMTEAYLGQLGFPFKKG